MLLVNDSLFQSSPGRAKGNMDQKPQQVPKQVQWYDDRFYEFEFEEGRKEYFPSVTTKLGIVNKPFLAKWRGDVGNQEANRVMNEAMEKGTREHDAWETLCKQGAVLFNPRKKPVYTQEDINQYKLDYPKVSIIEDQEEMHDIVKLSMFLERVKPGILASELTVYDIDNRDAGTLDNILMIPGGEYMIAGSKPLKIESGIYVADLKSGKNIDRSAFKQTACYANCVKKMGIHEHIKGTLIIHTGASTRTGIEGLNVILRNQEQMEEDYRSYRMTAALWEDENRDYSPKVFSLPSMVTYKQPEPVENV